MNVGNTFLMYDISAQKKHVTNILAKNGCGHSMCSCPFRITASRELDLPVALAKRGSVIHCNKYKAVIPCSFNLHTFPHDVNNCTIALGSSLYGSKVGFISNYLE